MQCAFLFCSVTHTQSIHPSGYTLAAVGFGFQFFNGFALPFPLNLIFLPLTVTGTPACHCLFWLTAATAAFSAREFEEAGLREHTSTAADDFGMAAADVRTYRVSLSPSDHRMVSAHTDLDGGI